MTKQSSVKLSVISAMLLLAVGLPVASIVGNAPSHRSTAALETAPQQDDAMVMPQETIRSTATLPEMTIVGRAPHARPAAKARGEVRCERRQLESVSDGMVTVCATAI